MRSLYSLSDYDGRKIDNDTAVHLEDSSDGGVRFFNSDTLEEMSNEETFGLSGGSGDFNDIEEGSADYESEPQRRERRSPQYEYGDAEDLGKRPS